MRQRAKRSAAPVGAVGIKRRDASLLATDSDESPAAWLRSGSQLLIEESVADGSYPLRSVAADGTGARRTIADAPVGRASVSPDDRWLAFDSDRSGRNTP